MEGRRRHPRDDIQSSGDAARVPGTLYLSLYIPELSRFIGRGVRAGKFERKASFFMVFFRGDEHLAYLGAADFDLYSGRYLFIVA
jgi:hypothetical protein